MRLGRMRQAESGGINSVLLAFATHLSRGFKSRLSGSVPNEVANKNVGVEADHRRFVRTPPVAPLAIASFISSIVTGCLRGAFKMPRKADAGRLGRRTTLPSGCTKNFTLSPGFSLRCARIAFGRSPDP